MMTNEAVVAMILVISVGCISAPPEIERLELFFGTTFGTTSIDLQPEVFDGGNVPGLDSPSLAAVGARVTENWTLGWRGRSLLRG